MGKLAQATFFQRLSRTYLAESIDDLMEELKVFEKNATVRLLLESFLLAVGTDFLPPQERTTKANMTIKECK